MECPLETAMDPSYEPPSDSRMPEDMPTDPILEWDITNDSEWLECAIAALQREHQPGVATVEESAATAG
jgi:hypothetical protein